MGCSLKDSSWVQQSIVLALIKILRRLRPKHGSVLMLTSRLCVKYGRRIDLAEAETMRFISKSSSIPVPKVYLAFTRGDCTYILMERVEGTPLARGWVSRPESSKTKVLAGLRKMIMTMRDIPSEFPAIRSVSGGSLYDPRLPGNTRRFGLFADVEAFHRHLRSGLEHNPTHSEDLNKIVELHSQKWDSPTFTHGDLSSLNILCRGNDIVAIVDWETAGWYPSYWEYTTACQVNPQNNFWAAEIDNFLDPVPKALEMETLRQKYFGDF